MDVILEFFKRDLFAVHSNIELESVSPGHASARMTLQPHHWNGVQIAHGGAIFTLADLAFAAASNSHGTIAVAVNAHISYLKAATTGTLRAEAREVSCTKRLGTYVVEVRDGQGDLVALFQGMAYRKPDKLPIGEDAERPAA